VSAAALTLYVLALIVLFGTKSWMQHRRTGSTGFRGISGTPAEAGWWGGVLFIAAMVLGLAGPLLAVSGVLPADPQPVIAVGGLILAPAGFAATLAGQMGMGASWRIGVHPGERTDLVTTGVFAYVRNPHLHGDGARPGRHGATGADLDQRGCAGRTHRCRGVAGSRRRGAIPAPRAR
jgi:protein-S-isoprenylcysteine O-methyltransferase Ste14